MNKLNKPVSTIQSTLLWTGILFVTLAAFFCTYYYHFSGPVKALIWIIWLVLVLSLGCFTKQGQQALCFAKESKIELQKVVWPTRQETVQTTAIVMVMVAVTGLVLWGVDATMTWAISKITHLG